MMVIMVMMVISYLRGKPAEVTDWWFSIRDSLVVVVMMMVVMVVVVIIIVAYLESQILETVMGLEHSGLDITAYKMEIIIFITIVVVIVIIMIMTWQ